MVRQMTANAESDLTLAQLPKNQPTAFDLRLSPEAMADLAVELGILALRKTRLMGQIRPDGEGWHLTARLGATVTQACVISLEPVVTRIEETFERRYQPDLPEPTAEEQEMPEDDSLEPLPKRIALDQLLAGALALALPPYPRLADAELKTRSFAPKGVTPLSDEDVKPFAALRQLSEAKKAPPEE